VSVGAKSICLILIEQALVLVSIGMEKGARAMSSAKTPLTIVFGTIFPKLDAAAMLNEYFLPVN
jgi:hypothetical protein